MPFPRTGKNISAALQTNFFSHSGFFMLCSEIWKQLTLTFLVGHGVYNLWYFPFQLCSIPMYVFLVLPFARPEKVRRALLCFIMCYALLGGTIVFADTSGLHYSYAPLTVHSYLWHFLMIGTAVFSGIVFFREQPRTASSRPFSPAFPAASFSACICRRNSPLPGLLPDRSRN